MMRALVVGDPHLKLSMGDTAAAFVTQLLQLIQGERYDFVVLLGDQTDTYAILRSEIMALWSQFFLLAAKHTKIYVLVGNHDLSGADGGSHSMEAFKGYENVKVIDDLTVIMHPKLSNLDLVFMPFKRDSKEFEKACSLVSGKALLFCHQSFNGAQFENGFYDPHGADPECVAHIKQVVSGHIHNAQSLKNIWYPGTPFQHSFEDAGQDKNVYELDIDDTGYHRVTPRQLDMPLFEVFEADSVAELQAAIKELTALYKKKELQYRSFKLKAKGSPSEIVAFWQDPAVLEFKSNARRVVDALTSVKPTQILPGSQGKTQKEKLHEFVRQQKWRTSADRIIDRAEKLLAI